MMGAWPLLSFTRSRRPASPLLPAECPPQTFLPREAAAAHHKMFYNPFISEPS